MNAKIQSYGLDLIKSIYMDNNNTMLRSIEVDILVMYNETTSVSDACFTVRIIGDQIKIEPNRNDINYVILPYSVLGQIKDYTAVCEKIVVSDWLTDVFLKEADDEYVPRNRQFHYEGDEGYDVTYI